MDKENKAKEEKCEEGCCAGNCECGEVDETLSDIEGCEDIDVIKEKFQLKSRQCEEYFGMLQRAMADFENYKKRTAKEKLDTYSDAVCDVVGSFLPVIDNLERALQAASDESGSLKSGIEMVLKQVKETMKNLGVEEIKGAGEKFDPNLHNAVMHIDDESLEEGVVVDEFQKGYIFKEKVIRHSMVKVAN